MIAVVTLFVIGADRGCVAWYMHKTKRPPTAVLVSCD